MHLISIIDEENYDKSWRTIERSSVRAVIMRGNKVALVKYGEGYYKFPGGGTEDGESHTDTLVREVLEETGLTIIPDTIREIGEVREIRKSYKDEDAIYFASSYYYRASVEENAVAPSYTDEEFAEGCSFEWVDLEKAYATDLEFSRKSYKYKFVFREACVMRELIEKKK